MNALAWGQLLMQAGPLIQWAIGFVETAFGPAKGVGAQKLENAVKLIAIAAPDIGAQIASTPASATHLQSVINTAVAVMNEGAQIAAAQAAVNSQQAASGA